MMPPDGSRLGVRIARRASRVDPDDPLPSDHGESGICSTATDIGRFECQHDVELIDVS